MSDPHGHHHDGHEHAQRHDHGHEHHHDHRHEHPTGLKGVLYGVFVPHSHDAADAIDDALESNTAGIRALKISLVALGITAALQIVVVVVSGSVALAADTIHNFSDALTAVPLWIAFALGRRAATRRYTYGFGRVEDLAGLFVVAMIALSAIVAGYEAIQRFLEPRELQHLGWVVAAGVIGFVGNELVAVYRIRVGRRIGSAALVADGVHARTDGFTSLAVVAGAIAVGAGFPLADPIVGLAISVAIAVLLIGTARDIGRRLLDGVDPTLVDRIEHVISHQQGIESITLLQVRWLGHRLVVDARVATDPRLPVAAFHDIEHATDAAVRARVPGIQAVQLTPVSHLAEATA